MALRCSNLTCGRNGRVIFSNQTFMALPGQLLELRGPNGSGKSSLLRVIAGLLPATQGSVTWQDQSEPSQHCHYIGHLDGLKPALTVTENLTFWGAMFGGANIALALQTFALEALSDQPIQLLSAGQKRRVALARLVAASRPLWLLDEPATALDQTSRTHLSTAMQNHLADGGTIVMATHDDIGLVPHQTITLGQTP